MTAIRLLVVSLLLGLALVRPVPAMASEKSDGFALGRLAQAGTDLAADLYFIESLSQQFAVGKEELVGADPNNTDFALAGGALTYAIWRSKLAVVPACEEWLAAGALDSPGLKDYRKELRELLGAIQTDANAFLAAAEAGDQQALSRWTGRIGSAGYAASLLDISQRVTAAASQ